MQHAPKHIHITFESSTQWIIDSTASFHATLNVILSREYKILH